MPRNHYFLLLPFLLFSVLLLGQKGSVVIKTESKVAARNGELISLLLETENKRAEPTTVVLRTKTTPGLRVLSQSDTLKFAPQQKMFLPIKIVVERSLAAGKGNIQFLLEDTEKNIISQTSVEVTVAPKRALRISAKENQVLMYQVGDSLKVTAQVYNAGNQEEKTEIYATFPDGFGGNVTMKKELSLSPAESKDVTFSRIIDRALLRQELFSVNIAGIDSDKAYFGNAMVLVQNALGNRTYVDPRTLNNFTNQNRRNQISLSARNPFSKYEYSQMLDLHTEFNLLGLNTELNVNSTFWPAQSNDPLFQNTYLRVSGKTLGLKVGSLSTTGLELNLNGRGAEVSYEKGKENKTIITAGFLDKNFNLFDPLEWEFQRGFASYIHSSHILNDYASLSSNLIYDEDPFQENYLTRTGYKYQNTDKKLTYELEGALGYSTAKSTGENKPSGAIGLLFRKDIKNYSFSSSNYLSSDYYPGVRRGTQMFDQRISRSFKKSSLWLGFNLHNYDPKSVDTTYQYNARSSRTRLEAGIQWNISPRFQTNIAPQFLQESADITLNFGQAPTHLQFSAYLLNSTFSYSTPNNSHKLNLSIAQGLSGFSGYGEKKYALRSQLSYGFKQLMLNVNYQKGSFMLYENRQNLSEEERFERFTAMANYRVGLFANKLQAQLTALANYDSNSGRSYSLNSNLDYQLGRSTKLMAYIGYNTFSRENFSSDFLYYQLGVTQTLPDWGKGESNYKSGLIEVFVYYDLNNDNRYDPTVDKIGAGSKVRINRTIFIADKNGMVRYRRVPYGSYTVSTMENNWYNEDVPLELASKIERINLGLEKTGIIQGSLRYEEGKRTQYDVYDIKGAIPILLKNSLGKTFTVYTTDQGNFRAFLPLGSYEISVDQSRLQQNVYMDDNLRKATSKENEVSTVKEFILRVKEKKVEIKRFGS